MSKVKMYMEMSSEVKPMRHAAFVMFHDGKHVLMNMRKDGRWGFPGGVVEEGETIFEAACRECMEEIGANVCSDNFAGKLIYGGNHSVREGLQSHFYVFEKTYEELVEMLATGLNGTASHADEVNGMAMFNIDRQNFYKMNLAPTVIDELQDTFGSRMVKE